MNNVKTAVLLAGMIALLMAAGQLMGGTPGLILGSILGLGMNFVMYFFSDRMVLKMYGASVVTEQEAPELYPVAAMLIQFAISRQHEFEADRVGAAISGRPRALANALRRLDQAAHQIPMHAPPAVAPLAQVHPLAAMGGGMLRWCSTHPPIEERVAALEAMTPAR